MADAPPNLEEILKDAHLPALLDALVHMTGEPDKWLRPEWTPVYNPLSRGDTGYSAETEATIRSLAAEAIGAHLAGKPLAMRAPPTDVIRRQMDFVAGAPIP